MKKHNYDLVLLSATIFFGAATALQIYFNGKDEDSLRFLIASSAKMSATLFSVAFGISSLHYFLKDEVSAFLLHYRPHLGLAFGMSHTFHLSFLIWLQNSIHPVFTLAKTTSLIGGGMAYFFMYLMMITTFPRFKSKMNPVYWKALHLLGGYWIWFIFFKAYFRKVMNQNEGYAFFAILIIVLILRQVHVYFKRKLAK